MCRHHSSHRQTAIVALAGAIYGAYQSRKEKNTEASAQEIGLEGGKYAAVPQETHLDAAEHEKSIPPPDYEYVVKNRDDIIQDTDPKDHDAGICYDDSYHDKNAFLATGINDEVAQKSQGNGVRVKMGFFGRLHAKKEEKRAEREERREAWRANRRDRMESRAERCAEWRAGMSGRGCGRRAW
jgi:hypothetical protein